MRTPSNLVRSSLLAASAVTLAAVLTGCGASVSGPMTTSTTGYLDATAIYTGVTGTPCTDSSTWNYTAVSLDGQSGDGGPVVHTHHGETTTATQNQCRSHDAVSNLKLGTWRLTWSGGRTCVLNLHSVKWVTIQQDGTCQTHL
jgi:hypothetical protein